jgi:hypothetical protein
MYGMVNIAIEQLITETYGTEVWEKVKTEANVSEKKFINMQPYDDKITYQLVQAASEILSVDANLLLERFGEYWILYTAKEGYGDMLKLGGKNLPEFLKNLNMLHFRLGNMMPELVPPSFEVRDVEEKKLTLIYKSKREGFIPMVIGLVKGLGIMFNTPCQVTLADNKILQEKTFIVSW